jgi:hypothetical protein
MNKREYFEKLIYKPEEVRAWLDGSAYPWNRHDGELGYLLNSGKYADGINGAWSTYTYTPSGERLMVNHADRPCRINTYGNSVTQCHQVNDGETWQEYLAAHIGEPVRNYGIGGFSVYQAYLRMLREEKQHPAEYIIFNIFIDDHLRSLSPWKAIRYPKIPDYFSTTQPYLTLDENGTCTKNPNPCPTEEDLYNLCDLDWVCEHFGDNLVTQMRMKYLLGKDANPNSSVKALMDMTKTHGVNTLDDISANSDQQARNLVQHVGFLSSLYLVDKIRSYARQNNKKVLFVLSHLGTHTVKYCEGEKRSDQIMVDYFEKHDQPYVDLLTAHAAEFSHMKVSAIEYMSPYCSIGHYSPAGNFFQAFAIKEKLVKMLSPNPPSYPDGHKDTEDQGGWKLFINSRKPAGERTK